MPLTSLVKNTSPCVAILGAGLMGHWHAHAARRLGAQIVAVADPKLERARAISGDKGPVFQDSSSLLSAVRPDAVHLCSPTSEHGHIIREAISHGVHVFAEKPLATDVVETHALYELAQEEGLLLCPVHQYAFQTALDLILQQLDRIGTLELVEMRFFSAGADGADIESVPRIAADILPHPLSIVQRLWPELPIDTLNWKVTNLGAASWQIAAGMEPTTLRITLSLAARPTEASLVLNGTRGEWNVDLFHGFARFRDGTANRRAKALRPFSDGLSLLSLASRNLACRALRREPAYPGLRTLCAAFYAALAGRVQVPITADQAIAVAALRDQFLRHTG